MDPSFLMHWVIPTVLLYFCIIIGKDIYDDYYAGQLKAEFKIIDSYLNRLKPIERKSGPIVCPPGPIVYCDVDDTLVMWDENYTQPFEGAISMTCVQDGQVSYHRPHKRHISFLRKLKAKGYTVVVWTASESPWGYEAVKRLGLEDCVDFVLTKPTKVIDDLKNPSEIIPTPFYLSEDGHSL